MAPKRSTDAAAPTTGAPHSVTTGPRPAATARTAVTAGSAEARARDHQGPTSDDVRRLAQLLLGTGTDAVGCLVSPSDAERRDVAREVHRRVSMRQGTALELSLSELGPEASLALIGRAADACRRAAAAPTTVVLDGLPLGDTDYCEAVSDLMARLRASGATVVACVSPEDEPVLDWVGRHVCFRPDDPCADAPHDGDHAPRNGDWQHHISRIPAYITTEQAAYLLSVSPDLIRKHVRSGVITETCRVGTLLRIRTRPFLDRFGIPIDEAYDVVPCGTGDGPKGR